MWVSRKRHITFIKILEWALLLSVYLVSFTSFRETIINFDVTISESLIPIFKFPKYFLGLILFLSGIIVCNWRGNYIISKIVIGILAASVLLGLYFQYPKFYIICGGLVWVFPMFLVFLLIGNISHLFIIKLRNAITILSIYNFIIIILEIISANFWDSTIKIGLTARPPGIFLIPSESALLNVLCLYLWSITISNYRFRKYIIVINFCSIFLCTSFAGIFAIFVLYLIPYLWKMVQRKKWWFISLMFILGSIVVYYLNRITGRNGAGIQFSGMARMKIFNKHFNIKNYLPYHFGEATNFTKSLASQYKAVAQSDTFIADSLITSTYYNLGWGFCLLIFVLIAFYIFKYVKKPNLNQIKFLIIIAIFSTTLVLTECFPFNYILAAIIGHSFSHKSIIEK